MNLLSDSIMQQASMTFVSTVEQKFLLGRTKNSITPQCEDCAEKPKISQMQKSVNHLCIVFTSYSYCLYCKSGVLQVVWVFHFTEVPVKVQISCNLEPSLAPRLFIGETD